MTKFLFKTMKYFLDCFHQDANPYLCEVCYVNNLLWIRPEMNMSFAKFQDFQDEMINPTTLNAKDVLLPYDKVCRFEKERIYQLI